MNNCQCIIGNHEYDFLKFYRSIMENTNDGADYKVVLKRLQDFFPHDGYLLDWDIINKLDKMPSYIEYNDFICVHAGVRINKNKKMIPLEENSCEDLVYNRFFKNSEFEFNDKCIIFGHTPTRYITNTSDDRILLYERYNIYYKNKRISNYYKIHIDTGVYLSGILGCLCVDTCEEFYVKKD